MAPQSLKDARFNRVFELSRRPGQDQQSSFKITYADYGYHNEDDANNESVFLWFGSLTGSRLLHIAKDELAKQHTIRIIDIDRPGIGGTDPADAGERMAIWLEVVPALLTHLDIKHVSVGCHSGGTVYALDFILHHPEFLNPQKPYLAIAAPWILPSHTGSIPLNIFRALPSRLIANTDKLARLINNYVGPSIGFSVGSVQNLFSSLPSRQPSKSETVEQDQVRAETELWPKIMDRVYSEGIEGISADAILFLQKVDGTNGWSDWGDYDTLTPRLAEALRSAGRVLHVATFWPENDFVLGGSSTGAKWFDQYWSEASCGSSVTYSSTVVKHADHNQVWSLRFNAVQDAFNYVAQQSSSYAE